MVVVQVSEVQVTLELVIEILGQGDQACLNGDLFYG